MSASINGYYSLHTIRYRPQLDSGKSPKAGERAAGILLLSSADASRIKIGNSRPLRFQHDENLSSHYPCLIFLPRGAAQLRSSSHEAPNVSAHWLGGLLNPLFSICRYKCEAAHFAGLGVLPPLLPDSENNHDRHDTL